MNESVAVVILAGGESKRMNKKNKALVLLKDKPLIQYVICLLYTSPSPRDRTRSRMPSSA